MTSQKELSLSYTPPISLSPVFQSLLASRSPTDPYHTLHLCSGKNLLLISANSNSSTSTATHQPSSVSVSFTQSPHVPFQDEISLLQDFFQPRPIPSQRLPRFIVLPCLLLLASLASILNRPLSID